MLKIVNYFIHACYFIKIISFHLSWPKIAEIIDQDSLKKEPPLLYCLLFFFWNSVSYRNFYFKIGEHITVLSLQKCRGNGGFLSCGRD